MLRLIHTVPGDQYWSQYMAVPGKVFPYPAHQVDLKNQVNEEFFLTGVLALKDGLPIGRIAVYLNPHLVVGGLPTGTLGNYESIDDPDIGARLLDEGMSLLAQSGVEYVIGPMNGSTWDQYRFERSPDQPHFFLEPQHPAWYLDQWQAAGFESIGEYSSSIDHVMDVKEDLQQKVIAIGEKGIRIRQIDLDRYESELELLFHLSLKGFRNNHVYSPISRKSFFAKYLPIKSAIDPAWVLIAENEEREVGGFIFCFPDYWNPSHKHMVIKTLVRHPGRQWAGIGGILSALVIQKAQRDGFDAVIHAMMYDGGGGKSLSSTYQGTLLQEYVLLGKVIS